MTNRIIHFVFNEDIPNDKLGSFNTSISNIGKPIWPIPFDTASFLTCLKALGSEFKVSIWVHLQASEPNLHKFYAGNDFLQKKFYKEFGVELTKKVRFVTRANLTATDRQQPVTLGSENLALPVFSDIEFDNECLKKEWLVNVADIKNKDEEENDTEDDSILRIPSNSPFLVSFLQANEIDEINKHFCLTKEFVHKITLQTESLWHDALLRLINFPNPNPFQNNKYWEFKKDIFPKYFTLKTDDENYSHTISKNFAELEHDIKFNTQSKQWEIKLNFFYAIFERKRNIKDSFNWTNAPQEATALYLLHEALHQEHKLDYRTVTGIGNFPKTVEDADYQADAFAIIIEFCRFYFDNQARKISSLILKEKIVRLIRIAIETTFSFNPVQLLSGIQVRRVNRYLIWFYQICLIEKRVTDSNSPSDTVFDILNILSVKPVIEITGPALYVNKARDRILYDLNDYNRHDEELVIFKENIIERFGKTRDLKLETLIGGLRTSNYKVIYDYVSNLFWSKTK